MRHTTTILAVVLATTQIAQAGPKSPRELAKEHFNKGYAFYQAGQYLKAVKELKLAYSIRPVPLVLYYIGRTYKEAGLTEEAIIYFQRFLDEARLTDPRRQEVEGLIKELERYGHEAVPAGEARGCSPVARAPWLPESGDELDDIEVDFVVAGLDRTLTYTKLADALRSIRNGASLIATNDDPTLPWEGGKVLPGAGTVIAALERCSGVRAKVLGKPKPYTTFIAAREMGLEPKDILMIGDRLDTDIAAGRAAGCSVAMVLSGDMKDPGEEDLPTYPNLRELVNDIFL